MQTRDTILSPIELKDTFPEALPSIKRNLTRWQVYYREAKALSDELFDEMLVIIMGSDLPATEKDRLVAQLNKRVYEDEGVRLDGEIVPWSFTGQLHLKAIEGHVKRLEHLISLYIYKGTANAATITPEDIANAKNFSIGSFIEISRTGFIKCLWHSEKTASCKVFADNKFRCFGCQAHGDVVDIVRKLQGLEFLDAIRFILKK